MRPKKPDIHPALVAKTRGRHHMAGRPRGLDRAAIVRLIAEHGHPLRPAGRPDKSALGRLRGTIEARRAKP